jgi:phenylacetate-CoA ligase
MLQRLWGNKAIFEDYGSTETGSLAGECPSGNLHVWNDRIYFEILNSDTSEMSRFGKGKLVVTPLYREAMPLIRYLIEDEVELSPSQCSCASSRPIIKVYGRESDSIQTQNRRFFPRDLEDVIYLATLKVPVYFWKAEFDETNLTVLFHCEPHKAIETEKLIRSAIQNQLKVNADIVFCNQNAFLDSDLFEQKHHFSKPKFVLRKDTYENNYPTLR